MITKRFLRGRGREQFKPADLEAIEAAIDDVAALPARACLIKRGEPVTQSTYLIEGFVGRYMDDRGGHRQLVGLHVPGDFFDLHGFPMRRLDHDVITLGPAKVAHFKRETMLALTENSASLTRMLWFSTLLDAAMHREWIFRLGRLQADGRLAHLMIETATRLKLVGLSDGGSFSMPLTQADLAEACGITAVHVNRCLRELRENGVLLVKAGDVRVLDQERLKHLAEFDPDYLYCGPWSEVAMTSKA